MPRKSKTIADPLTRREREIMNLLFALDNHASAEDIRLGLSEPPGGSAVRVMLSRLEKKGWLKQQLVDLSFHYAAQLSRSYAKRTALPQPGRQSCWLGAVAPGPGSHSAVSRLNTQTRQPSGLANRTSPARARA